MTITGRLIARLTQLKDNANTSMKSELSDVPTPLWVFVEIYSKANRECYLNYMQGAKCLESWLTTPDTPLVLSDNVQPNAPKLAHFLLSYETEQLIKVASRYVQSTQALGVAKAIDNSNKYEANILHYLLLKAGYRYDNIAR